MRAGRRSGAVARGRAVGCGSRRSHGAVAEVKRWRRSHGGGGCAVVEVARYGGRAVVEVARWWRSCGSGGRAASVVVVAVHGKVAAADLVRGRKE